MSLGLYDYERRHRRRVWARLFRFGFFLTFIVGTGLFAYQTGIEQHRAKEEELQQRIQDLRADAADWEAYADRKEEELDDALRRLEEVTAQYRREVPTGELRRLTDLVAARLREGIDSQRLAFFIDAAGPPHDCSQPRTRSFFMATPLWDGPNTSTAFAEGRIIVSGLGENARDGQGQVLPQFDPTEEVTLTFTTIDGEESRVAGTLPLQHAIVVGNEEFRFSVTEGRTSMVDVTADRCPFP
ncbi:MAG: hypothetical protein GVY13_00205 [Alphaproteobacteria bacterium]|jgi:hypothetical protein|nr:hypothetical protein [Alphaproteobacteria bacterium]